MTRLTIEMRAKIARKVLQNRFIEPICDLRRRRADLACRVYDESFKDIRAAMDALPKGWLPEKDGIVVSLGTTNMTTLDFNGGFSTSLYGKEYNLHSLAPNPEDVVRRFPSKLLDRPRHVFDAVQDFTIEYDRQKVETEDLNELIATTSKATAATLDKFWTVEKLLAGWPEIEPFTRGVTPTPPATALVVPVSKLNEALGLPVDEEAGE